MSFSNTVKNELSKLELSDVEKIAQLSAIVMFANKENGIKITTEMLVSRALFLACLKNFIS